MHFKCALALCPTVSFTRSESVHGLKLQDKRRSNKWLWNCIRAFLISGSITLHTTRCVPLRSGLQLSGHGSPVSVQWKTKETQEERAWKETSFLWLHCLLVSPTLQGPSLHKMVLASGLRILLYVTLSAPRTTAELQCLSTAGSSLLRLLILPPWV